MYLPVFENFSYCYSINNRIVLCKSIYYNLTVSNGGGNIGQWALFFLMNFLDFHIRFEILKFALFNDAFNYVENKGNSLPLNTVSNREILI